MANETRIVSGRFDGRGFVKEHKALIKPSRSFWRDGWCYVIYDYWTSWGPCYESSWYPTRDECEAAANRHLDRIEASDEGEWLATTEPEATDAT